MCVGAYLICVILINFIHSRYKNLHLNRYFKNNHLFLLFTVTCKSKLTSFNKIHIFSSEKVPGDIKSISEECKGNVLLLYLTLIKSMNSFSSFYEGIFKVFMKTLIEFVLYGLFQGSF